MKKYSVVELRNIISDFCDQMICESYCERKRCLLDIFLDWLDNKKE